MRLSFLTSNPLVHEIRCEESEKKKSRLFAPYVAVLYNTN